MTKSAGASSDAEYVYRGVRFLIYPRRTRKPPGHLLTYYVGSRRHMVSVRGERSAAEARARTLAQKITTGEENEGLNLTPLDRRIYLSAKAAVASLDRPVDAICRDYLLAQEIVGVGVTVIDAAKAYARQHAHGLRSATVSQVVGELLEHLASRRRDPVTISTLRSILKQFAAGFPGMQIAHVRREEIDTWLSGHHRKASRTLNNYRSAVVRLFHFAKGRYLPKDGLTVADHVEPISRDSRGEIAIFRPWEMAAILEEATGWNARPKDAGRDWKPTADPCLPALLLGAFAGVRTIELCRMEWSALHREPKLPLYPNGYIEIKKATAKQHRTASRRLIPIQPNLAAWLEPYQFKTQGRIFPRNSNSLGRAVTRVIREVNKRRAKHRLELVTRAVNGCRHSYGSYRLPVLQSVDALRLEMGNSVDEIFKNYRELVPPSDVELWWNLLPPTNIVQLKFDEMESARG